MEQIDTKEKFQDVIKGKHLSVIHFSSAWAEQCRQVDDLLDSLSKKYNNPTIKFFKCDAEHLSDVSLAYKIDAVPTVILLNNGKAFDRVEGVNPKKLSDSIKRFADLRPTADGQSLEDRLKALIGKHKIMLFMKGDPETPRCGFSRKIVEILRNVGEEFGTFDILEDEEVRQGLKKYSDWPTYPQLYVNGELIGGLDIVNDLLSSGELESTLKC